MRSLRRKFEANEKMSLDAREKARLSSTGDHLWYKGEHMAILRNEFVGQLYVVRICITKYSIQ
jgi:hypothetical protein